MLLNFYETHLKICLTFKDFKRKLVISLNDSQLSFQTKSSVFPLVGARDNSLH